MKVHIQHQNDLIPNKNICQISLFRVGTFICSRTTIKMKHHSNWLYSNDQIFLISLKAKIISMSVPKIHTICKVVIWRFQNRNFWYCGPKAASM